MTSNVADARPETAGTAAPERTASSVPYTPPTDDGTRPAARRGLAVARTAALLRIGLGLVYLWAFVAQGFGITYTNRPAPPPGAPPAAAFAMPPDGAWHFSYDASNGFLTSGLSSSPSAGYLRSGTHGPLAFVPDTMPGKANDVLWMFALGGLGIALTLGIFSKAAAWGGMALNVLLWFSSFPPQQNPLLDGTHMIYALVLVLLMFLRAGDHWGLGRWWRAHTPAALH